jgi:hypothetical protein
MFHKDFSDPMISGLFRRCPLKSVEIRKNGAFLATALATVLGFLNTSLKTDPNDLCIRRCMSRQAAKSESANHPEFVVYREGFDRFFEKPLPTSTFHDLVNKGKITPFKHIRGMYYLNASLRRLGLKEVAELPKAPPQPSLENITRFAFTIIDPDLFPAPSWLRFTEMIDERVADHALLLANTHRDNVEALDDVRVKMSYFQATLDVAATLDAEGQE